LQFDEALEPQTMTSVSRIIRIVLIAMLIAADIAGIGYAFMPLAMLLFAGKLVCGPPATLAWCLWTYLFIFIGICVFVIINAIVISLVIE
jgi:hypothetical protein